MYTYIYHIHMDPPPTTTTTTTTTTSTTHGQRDRWTSRQAPEPQLQHAWTAMNEKRGHTP